MKSIEEIKKEILLMIMNGEEVLSIHIKNLPKNDEIRSFVCSLGPLYACLYAFFVDKGPHEETKKSANKDPNYGSIYSYIIYVEGGHFEYTRKSSENCRKFTNKYLQCISLKTRKEACANPYDACSYAYNVDKSPHEETQKAAYLNPISKQVYIQYFGE